MIFTQFQIVNQDQSCRKEQENIKKMEKILLLSGKNSRSSEIKYAQSPYLPQLTQQHRKYSGRAE